MIDANRLAANLIGTSPYQCPTPIIASDRIFQGGGTRFASHDGCGAGGGLRFFCVATFVWVAVFIYCEAACDLRQICYRRKSVSHFLRSYRAIDDSEFIEPRSSILQTMCQLQEVVRLALGSLEASVRHLTTARK